MSSLSIQMIVHVYKACGSGDKSEHKFEGDRVHWHAQKPTRLLNPLPITSDRA